MNFLEKRIKERAKSKFSSICDKTNDYIGENDILKRLTIKVCNKKEEGILEECCINLEGLFDSDNIELLENYTNFKEIKETITKSIEKHETDNLLSSFRSLEELYNKDV